MLSRISNFFGRIESDKTPLRYWLASFFAIIVLRNILEGMLGECRCVFKPQFFFVSSTLSYVMLFLALAVILRLVTRAQTAGIMKVLVVLFSLLLVVPVVDFFAYGGSGENLFYLKGSADQIASNFWTYYEGNATVGQRAEGLAFGFLLMLYVYTKTKSLLKTAGAVFLAYCAVFVFAVLAPLSLAVSKLLFGAPDRGLLQSGGLGKELYMNYFSGQLTNLLSSLFIVAESAALLAATNMQKFRLLLKAMRPVRSAHYILLAVFGSLLGLSATGPFGFYWPFALSYAIAVFFAHQFACLVNDLFDNDMHARIRAKKADGDTRVMKKAAGGYLALSLVFGYIAGYESLVVLVCAAALAFIYSAPPLRLKRFPIVASGTLALMALLVVLGGFAVFLGKDAVKLFPHGIAAAILLVYTLGTNYKDLKGVEADRKSGVYTIPVLLGERNGKAVIAALTILSFALVPLVLGMPGLVLPSAVACVLSALLIAKGSDERLFRGMHLCYLLLVMYFLV